MVISILRQDTREEPMRERDRWTSRKRTPRPGHHPRQHGPGLSVGGRRGDGRGSFYAWPTATEGAARAAARWMAERAWARRAELAHAPSFTPREALEHAMRAPRGPFLLLDVGDNVGAGSAGDSTFILAEAQRLGVAQSAGDVSRSAGGPGVCRGWGWGRRIT